MQGLWVINSLAMRSFVKTKFNRVTILRRFENMTKRLQTKIYSSKTMHVVELAGSFIGFSLNLHLDK